MTMQRERVIVIRQRRQLIIFTLGLQLSQIQRFRYHMIADTFTP